ncbi:hypothetical protein RRG08_037800 [Elysia crispata]|uniref:Uncharacterized protein n=1 Tax=Elysia crispata TaxID=231223 RepID=A0AAE1BDY5_9GAST|nr:hypothetical protein RRG08_037800 [Elysia crispata]
MYKEEAGHKTKLALSGTGDCSESLSGTVRPTAWFCPPKDSWADKRARVVFSCNSPERNRSLSKNFFSSVLIPKLRFGSDKRCGYPGRNGTRKRSKDERAFWNYSLEEKENQPVAPGGVTPSWRTELNGASSRGGQDLPSPPQSAYIDLTKWITGTAGHCGHLGKFPPGKQENGFPLHKEGPDGNLSKTEQNWLKY